MEETFSALRKHVSEMKRRFSGMKDDAYFVAWFTHAHIAPSEDVARKALTGKSGDRGADAVFIDDRNHAAYVIQGKFRTQIEHRTEKAEYVRDFGRLAELLPAAPDEQKHFWRSVKGVAKTKLLEVNAKLRLSDPYRLHLVYATLGKFSSAVAEEAKAEASRRNSTATLSLLSGRTVLAVWKDYEVGVAPAVPVVELAIQGTPFERDPNDDGVEAMVFSMQGLAISDLYSRAGIQVFAKNVRGYLGQREGSVSKSMHDTLSTEPHNFWFYNNGITIVCDDAQYRGTGSKKRLLVHGAQIINGQQTTYTLSRTDQLSPEAEVLVRLIKIPPDLAHREQLISKIVRGANFQAPVSMADLKSNDPVQVMIERDLRSRNYWYIRKKYEPEIRATLPGADLPRKITKEDLAKAVGGADAESLALRLGTKRLFSENEGHYEDIFFNETDYLLCCWWVWKRCGGRAYGDPRRKWAKFVVQYFIWQKLKQLVLKRPRRFIAGLELEDEEIVEPLEKLIDIVFDETLAAYDTYRKKHGEVEVSPYFKGKEHGGYKNLDDRWRSSSAGSSQASFNANMAKLRVALDT